MYVKSNLDLLTLYQGSFYDVLKHMEETLNFTTKIYRRKSGGWGMPIIYPNKSIQLSPGMVNDLKDGSADMIVTALTILYSRKYVIDFLHPIMPEIGGKDFPSLIISDQITVRAPL